RQKRQYAERKEKADTYVNQTPFRYVERNFKSRVPPPDLSHVVDFNNLDNNLKRINDEIVELHITNDLRSLSSLFGEHDTEWENRAHKAYGLKSSPGFIFIPNPFTPRAQRHLVKQCLSEYTLSPSTSNLDTHYVTPPNGFWNLYEREHLQDLKEGDADYFVAKKAGFTGSEQRYDSIPTPTACSREFEPVQWQPKPDPPPAPSVPLLSPRELFRKMRWTTIGCHYHWPTKTYHLDRRFPVPEDVRDLTQAVAHAVERVGYEGDKSRSWKNEYLGADFKAEAGVVNYYQYKDTLMGHVDRSELNMDAPLVSLSLGHTCIYLLGGPTQDTVPVSIYLRSGDIVVMTKHCRQYFHGVPKIIEDTLPAYLSPQTAFTDTPDWEPFGTYMQTSRINLNVRQVFPK
ncbi:hypothetical protein PHYBLDRAFT_99020, partial [Phycomyces blakesleeanus NRRL 1555(-)]